MLWELALNPGPLGLSFAHWNIRVDHLRMASNSGHLESDFLLVTRKCSPCIVVTRGIIIVFKWISNCYVRCCHNASINYQYRFVFLQHVYIQICEKACFFKKVLKGIVFERFGKTIGMIQLIPFVKSMALKVVVMSDRGLLLTSCRDEHVCLQASPNQAGHCLDKFTGMVCVPVDRYT